MEQNIAEIDGIVEDVLDRAGEESSKSCGVVVLRGDVAGLPTLRNQK